MDILIVAHKQEIEELKRKQWEEIQTIKDYKNNIGCYWDKATSYGGSSY